MLAPLIVEPLIAVTLMLLAGWALDAVRNHEGDKPVMGMPDAWNPLNHDAW